MNDEPPVFVPPRPFFLAGSRADGASGSDTDPDSDREQPQLTRTPRRRGTWSPPESYYRPPPSSFTFPFQAYPGNPDPGMSIPGSRRSSVESIQLVQSPVSQPTLSTSSSAIFRHSAGPSASLTMSPTNASTHSFRAPFLSPASRPSSSLWSPPSYPNFHALSSPSPPPLPPATKPLLPSTRLSAPLTKDDKPWLESKDSRTTLSRYLTLTCLLLGLAGAAALCYFGVKDVHILKDSQLCLVLNEQFTGSSLDESVWNRDIDAGGFGNNEFQMTTNLPQNLYINNNQLYITPTLTYLTLGMPKEQILDGGSYTLDGCTGASAAPSTNSTASGTSNNTTTNGNGGGNSRGGGSTTGNGGNVNRNTRHRRAPSSLCTVTSSASSGTVLNPIMSARINTRGKKSIRFGKVEVVAKLPRGDWLWPAIWMLPENETYGAWPVSGEIDIMEARGNSPSYPAQGSNYVRSSLNYGPFPALPERDPGGASVGASVNTGGGGTINGGGPEGTGTGRNGGNSTRGGGANASTNGRGNNVRHFRRSFASPSSSLHKHKYVSKRAPAPLPPAPSLLASLFGWQSTKRGSFAGGFHTYALEWADGWMRFWVDGRTRGMLEVDVHGRSGRGRGKGFFERGRFPATAQNGSSEVVVDSPWRAAGGGVMAPFDQEFYLVIDLAAGGTSGWFPDNKGGKMWYDGSASAMREFAEATEEWYATWPESADDRAFRIDSVKMWKLCGT